MEIITSWFSMMVINPRKSMKLVLVLFLSYSLTVCARRQRPLSEDDDLEIKQRLKLINKPPIKSFQTEHGDIVDCIDIHKQLAFDHPLLQNHKIQMKPEVIPKMTRSNAAAKETTSVFLPKLRCPQGTVAVKRAVKEDLLMSKYLSSVKTSIPQPIYSPNAYFNDSRFARNAVVEYRGVHYGSKANLNAWSPSVAAPDQFSTATVLVANTPSILQAGWGVNKYLYNDFTRLYTYWTGDGYQDTGCFNLLCPGFVQVSSEIPLGLILDPISTYAGKQYYIAVGIVQDLNTSNWWLVFGEDKLVGYWPSSIIPTLKTEATYSASGGIAYSPFGEASPAMGSGHFPEEGFGKAAYINMIKIVDKSHKFVDPDTHTITVDEPQCYNLRYVELPDPAWGHGVFFGGPGHCTG